MTETDCRFACFDMSNASSYCRCCHHLFGIDAGNFSSTQVNTAAPSRASCPAALAPARPCSSCAIVRGTFSAPLPLNRGASTPSLTSMAMATAFCCLLGPKASIPGGGTARAVVGPFSVPRSTSLPLAAGGILDSGLTSRSPLARLAVAKRTTMSRSRSIGSGAAWTSRIVETALLRCWRCRFGGSSKN